jgi:hypothetical protein
MENLNNQKQIILQNSNYLKTEIDGSYTNQITTQH